MFFHRLSVLYGFFLDLLHEDRFALQFLDHVGDELFHLVRVFLDFFEGKDFSDFRVAYCWKAVGSQFGEIAFGMVENYLIGEVPELPSVVGVNNRRAQCCQGEAVDDAVVCQADVFLAVSKVENGYFGKV